MRFCQKNTDSSYSYQQSLFHLLLISTITSLSSINENVTGGSNHLRENIGLLFSISSSTPFLLTELHNADLTDAVLRVVGPTNANLIPEQLTSVTSIAGKVLPDGFACESAPVNVDAFTLKKMRDKYLSAYKKRLEDKEKD